MVQVLRYHSGYLLLRSFRRPARLKSRQHRYLAGQPDHVNIDLCSIENEKIDFHHPISHALSVYREPTPVRSPRWAGQTHLLNGFENLLQEYFGEDVETCNQLA